MKSKKILMVGRWGKTHALGKAIVEKSSQNTELFCYMDKENPGLLSLVTDYKVGNMKDNDDIAKYAKYLNVDYVIAVPHMSLRTDIADYMDENSIKCIGPNKRCSKLETSKNFLRNILTKNDLGVSPKHFLFTSKEEAIEHIKNIDYDFAVKPVGVTEGDGVKVVGIQLEDKKEAISYTKEVFDKNIGGIPQVLIEEKLIGREYTIQTFVDEKVAWGMPATRDYKLLYEGEKGINTPGMGSISFPNHLLPFLSKDEYYYSLDIISKVLHHLRDKYGDIYKGFLSGQFIKTKDGIKVIEFNVRPGDSEILNIVPILKTDFVEICDAILQHRLKEMEIVYENKATVCKYVVGEGFPHSEDNMIMDIDEEGIKEGDGELFYSCFKVRENVYEPSPRGVAVTVKGDNLTEAHDLCEKLINENITGDKIWHREDIGTLELLNKHRLD